MLFGEKFRGLWIFHHLQYIIPSQYAEKEYKEQGSKSVFDACALRAFRQRGIKSKQSAVEISDQEHYQKSLSVNTVHYAIHKCSLKPEWVNYHH